MKNFVALSRQKFLITKNFRENGVFKNRNKMKAKNKGGKIKYFIDRIPQKNEK